MAQSNTIKYFRLWPVTLGPALFRFGHNENDSYPLIIVGCVLKKQNKFHHDGDVNDSWCPYMNRDATLDAMSSNGPVDGHRAAENQHNLVHSWVGHWRRKWYSHLYLHGADEEWTEKTTFNPNGIIWGQILELVQKKKKLQFLESPLGGDSNVSCQITQL